MLRYKVVGLAVLVVLAVCASPAAANFGRPGSATVHQYEYAGLRLNVATVNRGAHMAVKPRQAYGSVTSLRPVSSACQRCAAAVNADFFDESTREPIGGVIVGGTVLRSPNPWQNQLTIAPSGRITAGIMQWRGDLAAADGTVMPVAVNDPAAASMILYDGHFGTITPRRNAVEMALIPRQSGGLRLNRELRFRLVGAHGPGRVVPPGQVVLSGSGYYGLLLGALRTELRAGRIAPTFALRMRTEPAARDSLGANHVLLRAGRIVPIAEYDSFVFGAHPRTLFGWDKTGRVTLVTIGSAVPGKRGGVSLPAAAGILKSLGVKNAVNLDGGGSSTFVRRGKVLNNPSDGSQRSVSNVWVVIRP